jgi:hypothetical protein
VLVGKVGSGCADQKTGQWQGGHRQVWSSKALASTGGLLEIINFRFPSLVVGGDGLQGVGQADQLF